MEEFQPRTFKFKAWNQEARLLMKLSSIDFKKGELYKKDHVLLQFTGMVDKHEEEIYELDILIISDQKFLVRWNDENNGWHLVRLEKQSGNTVLTENDSNQSLLKDMAGKMKRLCNYFESELNQ